MLTKAFKRGVAVLSALALMSSLPAALAEGESYEQPVLNPRVKSIIEADGYQFIDLNANGELDVYEDWRKDAETRAADLVGQMTVREKIAQMQHPTFLPRSHPLASVNGSFNAVFLKGHACQEMMLQGRGAGDMPTASAIVGDLLHAASVSTHLHPTFRNTASPDPALTFTDNWTTRYYIRLSATDTVGVLARVADGFARCNVSIASMVQKDADTQGRVPLILVTHPAPEHALRAAVQGLDPDICRVESVIRVEE